MDEIAEVLERDRSAVINEALDAYLELHHWQIEHIRRGLAEAEAGVEGVAQEKVFDRLRARIRGAPGIDQAMIIVWRRQAERDLQHIFDFILDHDPAAAHHMCDRIERRVAQLRDHPQIGRPGRVAGTRELVVAGTPYVVAYRVVGARVDVLAVLHSARRWPVTFE